MTEKPSSGILEHTLAVFQWRPAEQSSVFSPPLPTCSPSNQTLAHWHLALASSPLPCHPSFAFLLQHLSVSSQPSVLIAPLTLESLLPCSSTPSLSFPYFIISIQERQFLPNMSRSLLWVPLFHLPTQLYSVHFQGKPKKDGSAN